jgi:hypothetical protein
MEFLHIEKNNKRKENSRKLICSALSLKFLIFKENSGISAFKI